jgi:glycosyltransferase involved in cell wall biosynthesis
VNTGHDLPLVSVIVPTFNQGRFIRETLDSILEQDYRPLEVLVMDGGSKDETIDVLTSYKASELNWVSEPDGGVTDAVNKGLKAARGNVIGIQSSDDVYLPDAISAIVSFMNEQPDAALVYGDVEYIDQESKLLGREILQAFDLKDYLGRFTYIPQPTAFFRSSVVNDVGTWRREVSYAADADYWLRIAVRHKVVKFDGVLARYRYHPDQRDRQRAKIARDWERSVRDLLSNNDLNASTKRYARMGIHLARHSYTTESKWLARTWHLYNAALANPRAVPSRRFPKRELLPGREPVFKLLSRVKRRLGFKPRGTQSPTSYSVRKRAGALIHDLPRYLWGMRARGPIPVTRAPWLSIRNRGERLITGPERKGVLCQWQWTSDLHITRVFPSLGLRLMRRALRDWPITTTPHSITGGSPPDVSFIIGHKGVDRLPLLLTTLASIADQRDCSVECVVVEQSISPEIQRFLPLWVKYVHTPLPDPTMPYCRAWALNVGARAARGRLLVLHDNDMLVPHGYGAELTTTGNSGYEVINLKRFIFYLSRDHSEGVVNGTLSLGARPPENVMQNAEAGGTLAITRAAYFEIGAFDESFIGWGGEDTEFWERAQTRRVWYHGYLPFIHLWHAPQAGKLETSRVTAPLYQMKSVIPVGQRISDLSSRETCAFYLQTDSESAGGSADPDLAGRGQSGATPLERNELICAE